MQCNVGLRLLMCHTIFNSYVFSRGLHVAVRLSRSKQIQHNRPGKSLNTCCAVIVDGVEIGRTLTVPNSSEPLWAAVFFLPIPRERTRTISSRSVETAPLNTEDLHLNILFQVWNDDPASSPVIIGRAALPPDVVSELIMDGNRSENTQNNDIHNLQEGGLAAAKKRRSLALDLRLDNPENKAVTEASKEALSGILSVSVESIAAADSNIEARESDSARYEESQEYLDDARGLERLTEKSGSVGRSAIRRKPARQIEVRGVDEQK